VEPSSFAIQFSIPQFGLAARATSARPRSGQQHRQDQDPRTSVAPRSFCEEESERSPEHDLDRDRAEGEDEGVLGPWPELGVREELPVVREPIQVQSWCAVVRLERPDQARDERIDRERDQKRTAGPTNSRASPPLGGSDSVGPAVDRVGRRPISFGRLLEVPALLEDCDQRSFAFLAASAALDEPKRAR